jgi:prevent-host-death family protein
MQPMHLTEDILAVSDLKRNTRAVIEKARRSGRPVLLTHNGKADAVLMDAETFEREMDIRILAEKLQAAERQVAAGQTRPVRAFLADFKRRHAL